jgi:hypothetical protein
MEAAHVAGEGATMGQAQVRLGMMPCAGGVQPVWLV